MSFPWPLTPGTRPGGPGRCPSVSGPSGACSGCVQTAAGAPPHRGGARGGSFGLCLVDPTSAALGGGALDGQHSDFFTKTRCHSTRFGAIDILVKELHCATKLLHAHPDFTFQLAISTFSVNVRSDLATYAALSYSERLALAAVGRGTSRASNDHATARFRARRRDCGGGVRVLRGALD